MHSFMILHVFISTVLISALAVRSVSEVPTCKTIGCTEAAKHLLSTIDESVDPCDDFYSYACGTWIKNHPIPEDKSKYAQFQHVRERVIRQLKGVLSDNSIGSYGDSSPPTQMAKQMFKSCMDIDKRNKLGTSQLHSDLSELGSMPMLSGSKWSCKRFDFTKLLSKAHRFHSTAPFYSSGPFGDSAPFIFILTPFADSKNTSRVLFHVDQGKTAFGLGAEQYFLDKELQPNIKAYKTLISKSMNKLAKDNGLVIANITDQIDELIDFETKIAKILTPEEDRRNATRLYNPRKIQDLDEILPFIDWEEYLKTLLPKKMENYAAPDTEIILMEKDYFPKLVKLIQGNDNCRVFSNYIQWRIIYNHHYNLDEEFEDIRQEFDQVFQGLPEKPKRWKTCAKVARNVLGQAVGALYVQKHFDIDARTELTKMVKNIRQAFLDIVYGIDWMDNVTKKIAKEKAEKIITKLGFPDMAFDGKLLQQYYKRLGLNGRQTYYEMVKFGTQWLLERQLSLMLKPFDMTEWEFSPAIVNAFYYPTKNQMIYPAAILQPPFFDKNYPKSINYRSMGFVIGHEITHGFDDRGRQFDKAGNLYDWWAPQTSKKFTKKAKCMIDQYGSVVVNENGDKINGKLTQGENIADNGGIRDAFLAYRKYIESVGREEAPLPGLTHLHHNKLFFISTTQFWCGSVRPEALKQIILRDPHSPYKSRVNLPLMNFPQFSKTFGCKSNSRMNPQKKCAVW